MNTLFIMFMKYVGVFVRPNDMTVYSYYLYRVTNVVLKMSFSYIFIWW
jgi:hypothetical protein